MWDSKSKVWYAPDWGLEFASRQEIDEIYGVVSEASGNRDQPTIEDITAKIRLLVDQENVDDVTFDAELAGQDCVLVTVGAEGTKTARTVELLVRERT